MKDTARITKMFRFISLLVLITLTGTYGGKIPKNWLVRHGRIVNGEPAQQGEFPSQLSLQVDESHNCGASIISEDWAVTACHCVAEYDADELSFYAGSVDLDNGGTRHEIETIIMHEEYDPGNNYINDIAVLKVKNPFKIDNVNVKPIPLPAQGENPEDDSLAVAIGWGYNATWDLPTHLYKVDLAIFNLDKCNAIYQDEGYAVWKGQICADTKEDGEHGTCGGDSGGPLMVDGTIVGLVSWAQGGCATPGYPTVFTRVSAYRDWIKEKTEV